MTEKNEEKWQFIKEEIKFIYGELNLIDKNC